MVLNYFSKILNVQDQSLSNKFALALLGSLIIAASSYIKIPSYPIPFTMQTFAVLMVALCLGRNLGIASVLLYISQGLAGLPVFTYIGVLNIFSPTFGYILGFIGSVFIASYAINKSSLVSLFFLVLASFFALSSGALWLSLLTGSITTGFTVGFAPFILIELFKALLAFSIIKSYKTN